MPSKGGPSVITPKSVIQIVVIAVIAIYLWGLFTEPGTSRCTIEDVEKDRHDCTSLGVNAAYETTKVIIPEEMELQTSMLWVIKVIILGVAAYIGLFFVGDISQFKTMSREKLFLSLLLIAAVYFVWEYIIVQFNILGADTFSDIAFKTAKKIGLG